MQRTIICLITILLLTQLSGCTNLPSLTKSKQNLSNTPVHTEKRPSNTLKQNLRTLLETNDYSTALDMAAEARLNNGSAPDVDAEFVLAMNSVLDTAEDRLTIGDYARAGQLLKQAQAWYPQEQKLKSRINLPPEELGTKLAFCSDELIEAGLVAYRAGELDTAMSLWQQVISFDPENITAQNALQITRTQMENLQTLEDK